MNALFCARKPPRPASPSHGAPHASRYLDPQLSAATGSNGRRRRRRHLTSGAVRQAGNVMVAVSKICRYPIKGLSAQPLSSVTLEADKPFPQDRIFALARPGAPIDRDDPKWAKKGLFVMLMLDENLARSQPRSISKRCGLPSGRAMAGCFRATRRSRRPGEDRGILLAAAADLAAPRRRWCARPAGISWTSRTTSSR